MMLPDAEGEAMEPFRCYQAAETTNVVTESGVVALGRADGNEAVVTISRVVGNERARALMRLCAAVLNNDLLAAQQELDSIDG